MSSKSIGEVAAYRPVSKLGMEELAMRQHGLKASGGILFARNPDGDEKIAARQLVLDLFSRANWPGRLNMLTLPGLRWRFERKLLGLREPGWLRQRRPIRTHFSAVENDRSLFFAACTQMPGIETPDSLIWPVRPDKYAFAEHAVKTRYASFFFANVDDFLAHEWQPATYRDTTGWHAAWLDYTGPLSIARLRAIQRFYDSYIHGILVVTAFKARWDSQTSAAITKAGSHSAWVREHLTGEVLHDIEYQDTSPMAQIAIRKKGTTP